MDRERIFRLLFQILLLAAMLEAGLRIVYYQGMSKEPLAMERAFRSVLSAVHRTRPTYKYKGYYLARPDSSREVNEAIAQEAVGSDHLQYSPWIDFRDADYSGKYINTSGLIRRTAPDSFFNARMPAAIDIYFIGGSTMYGFDVTDRETIPAYFVSRYAEKYPDGRSIRVTNYGICAYHSYDELMLLAHLFYSGNRPSIVIVMDGL